MTVPTVICSNQLFVIFESEQLAMSSSSHSLSRIIGDIVLSPNQRRDSSPINQRKSRRFISGKKENRLRNNQFDISSLQDVFRQLNQQEELKLESQRRYIEQKLESQKRYIEQNFEIENRKRKILWNYAQQTQDQNLKNKLVFSFLKEKTQTGMNQFSEIKPKYKRLSTQDKQTLFDYFRTLSHSDVQLSKILKVSKTSIRNQRIKFEQAYPEMKKPRSKKLKK